MAHEVWPKVCLGMWSLRGSFAALIRGFDARGVAKRCQSQAVPGAVLVILAAGKNISFPGAVLVTPAAEENLSFPEAV